VRIRQITYILLTALLTAVSCTTNPDASQASSSAADVRSHIESSADSLYAFVEAQTTLGARTPNSQAHKECVTYLKETFKRYGAEVTLQSADLTAHDGLTLHSTNIIASFNPSNPNRILIASHYDSRPWADEEALKADAAKPVMGANDGASGVAVMLEIARLISQDSTFSTGLDLICFDSEDYGVSNSENSFCLGSQYWASEARKNGYKAHFGILLDMVGDPAARFYREQVSDYYAKDIVDIVWGKAAKAGYSELFVNQPGGAITDDHYYVNTIAGIPCIDIIDFVPERGFPATWHTNKDVLENISKETLNSVCAILLLILNY